MKASVLSHSILTMIMFACQSRVPDRTMGWLECCEKGGFERVLSSMMVWTFRNEFCEYRTLNQVGIGCCMLIGTLGFVFS